MDCCDQHSGHVEAIKNLQDSEKDLWEHVNKIEEALPKLVPVWVTITLTIMGAVTGAALTFAGMMLKFAGGGN